MAPDARAELRALAEAATPGPWTVDPADEGRISGITAANGEEVVTSDCGIYGPDRPTADFIVAARTAIPELLDERDALRVDNQRLRAALKEACQLGAEANTSNGSWSDRMEAYDRLDALERLADLSEGGES